MENYFVAWEICEYPDMGGGTYYAEFDSFDKLEDHINKELESWKDKFNIIRSGYIQLEYNFEPVEIITKMKLKS